MNTPTASANSVSDASGGAQDGLVVVNTGGSLYGEWGPVEEVCGRLDRARRAQGFFGAQALFVVEPWFQSGGYCSAPHRAAVARVVRGTSTDRAEPT